MLLIPAIDLKDGHCVRLKQGDMDQSTTFGEDPAAMARRWIDAGARRLHLVDLNGAFAGKPKNYQAIKSILKEVGEDIPVQLGGGIRDLDTIEKYIDGGLRYVIIGTAAVKNPGFLKDACSAFGGHIIVGLDAKDGKVATDGWSKLTGHEVVDLARKFEDWGVESIVYTDIGRDGMLSGINIDATVKLAQALTIPVIASGGLGSMRDIEQLCAVESEGIEGVICGRAIYSGDLDFAAAQERADALNGCPRGPPGRWRGPPAGAGTRLAALQSKPLTQTYFHQGPSSFPTGRNAARALRGTDLRGWAGSLPRIPHRAGSRFRPRPPPVEGHWARARKCCGMQTICNNVARHQTQLLRCVFEGQATKIVPPTGLPGKPHSSGRACAWFSRGTPQCPAADSSNARPVDFRYPSRSHQDGPPGTRPAG